MLMITNTNAGAKLANGGASIVVNADGSITQTPVGLLTLGKIYYAAQNGLAAALAAAGSNGHVVVVDSQAVTTALTVPAGATLEVKRGGLLTFSGAGALTINGTFQAGLYQVFSGASPTFAAGSVEAVRPEWWGGKADGGVTDNRVAFDAMLATGAIRFQLARGNYAVKNADANGNGVTLSTVSTQFVGEGYAATTVTILCAVTWGIKATVAQVKIRDLAVTVGSGGSATYAVGVSTASVGSAESCAFSDIQERAASGGTVTNGFAVGPDNAGSGSMDIAEIVFTRCRADGPHSNAAFLIGNGTSGNVVNIFMDHCWAGSGKYGVFGAGSPFIFTDGTAQNNSICDFHAGATTGGPVKVDGVRSVSSVSFWVGPVSGSQLVVSIRNAIYNAQNLQASGVWIAHNMGGVVTLDNVKCQSPGAVVPVIQLEPIAGLVATLAGVAQAATLSSGIVVRAATAISVAVTGYMQLNSSDVTVASVPFTTLGAASSLQGQISVGVLGSGFAAKEGSNAKQGVATLVAGTVTVANTSVTASSRIQLTAQDNNTTGAVRVSARTAGTSFTITSSVGTDTGVVAYEIFEPA